MYLALYKSYVILLISHNLQMWKVITVLVPNAYILQDMKTKMGSANTILLGFVSWLKV